MSGVKLFGKPIRCNKAQADTRQEFDVGANIFVGNLDPEVDEKMLYDTFSPFGALQQPMVSYCLTGRAYIQLCIALFNVSYCGRLVSYLHDCICLYLLQANAIRKFIKLKPRFRAIPPLAFQRALASFPLSHLPRPTLQLKQ